MHQLAIYVFIDTNHYLLLPINTNYKQFCMISRYFLLVAVLETSHKTIYADKNTN